MRLQRLAKDEDSYAVGGCQAMYLAANGMFTVQGVAVDADTLANVENLLPGEGVVFIRRSSSRRCAATRSGHDDG